MAKIGPDLPRFHAMMATVASFGGTERGGLHRLAASPEDKLARDWLVAFMKENGFRVFIDAVGNICGVLEFAGPDAPLVMTGSHLDSQPYGGRFDGAYGVVAACEGALALKDAVASGALRATRNLGVVSWTNEEGARFQPSLIGSFFYTGRTTAESVHALRDGDGISLGHALGAIGYIGTDTLPRAASYVELHIECGPELEKAGRSIGVFTGWWGAIKTRVSILGEQAHTGPTAMAHRKDALYGASLLIAAIRGLADKTNAGGVERLYTSVGKLEVEPNSPNVVPGRATLYIELRSADPAVLTEAESVLGKLIEGVSATSKLEAVIENVSLREAGQFDAGLVRLTEAAAASAGHEAMHLLTIAAHDAVPLAPHIPSVVVAVPSVGGICHHEDEFTKPEDLEAGLIVLTDMLVRLCEGGR